MEGWYVKFVYTNFIQVRFSLHQYSSTENGRERDSRAVGRSKNLGERKIIQGLQKEKFLLLFLPKSEGSIAPLPPVTTALGIGNAKQSSVAAISLSNQNYTMTTGRKFVTINHHALQNCWCSSHTTASHTECKPRTSKHQRMSLRRYDEFSTIYTFFHQ